MVKFIIDGVISRLMAKKQYKLGKNLFLIFGLIQSLALGLIVFFILNALNTIGLDTQIVLSFMFPVFLLAVEYMIYMKK